MELDFYFSLFFVIFRVLLKIFNNKTNTATVEASIC